MEEYNHDAEDARDSKQDEIELASSKNDEMRYHRNGQVGYDSLINTRRLCKYRTSLRQGDP